MYGGSQPDSERTHPPTQRNAEKCTSRLLNSTGRQKDTILVEQLSIAILGGLVTTHAVDSVLTFHKGSAYDDADTVPRSRSG